MRTPEDFSKWASRRYTARHKNWLAEPPDEHDEHRFTLQAPSEVQAAADPSGVANWITTWRRYELKAPTGVRVDWVERRWRSLGVQKLPVAVSAAGPDALARVAGAPEWPLLTLVSQRLRQTWPDATGLAAELPGMAARLGSSSEADITRLISVVDWLREHPSSGLLPRQLPIAGVDTKWFEKHKDLVVRCLRGITGSPGPGLRSEDPRFRVRLLDPALRSAGPRDLTATVASLTELQIQPACVLIVENQESVAALPELPEVVAVHGQGFSAPELAAVPWVKRARILYWGDLDTHGLRILGEVRKALPHTEGVLMDMTTWHRFSTLAVPEPKPFRGLIGHLTVSEIEVLDELRSGDRRLEQERIDSGYVASCLRAALQR